MTLTPLHDYILVEWLPTDPIEKTGGGLFLPNRDPNQPKYAIVMAVGTGRTSETGVHFPPSVKVGDLVLTHCHAGTPIELEGRTYRAVREGAADIIAIVATVPDEAVAA